MPLNTFARSSPHFGIDGSIAATTLTSTAWTSIGTIDARFIKTKRLYLTAVSTQDLGIRVKGSFDGGTTYPLTALSSFSLNSASTDKTITDYYTDLQIEVCPGSTDIGTSSVAVSYCGVSF